MHTMTEPEPMEDRVTKPGLTRILGSPTIPELKMRVPHTMSVASGVAAAGVAAQTALLPCPA
jgi:hypothetical protein